MADPIGEAFDKPGHAIFDSSSMVSVITWVELAVSEACLSSRLPLAVTR